MIPLVNKAFQIDYLLDTDTRKALRDTHQDIFQRLSLLEQGGEITEFTRQSIKAMIDKVAMFRANRYASVKKRKRVSTDSEFANSFTGSFAWFKAVPFQHKKE